MQTGGTSGFVELLHDTGSAEAHAVVNGLQPGKWCLPSTREPARRERTRAWREGELSRRDRGLRAAGTSSESRHGRLADWARRVLRGSPSTPARLGSAQARQTASRPSDRRSSLAAPNLLTTARPGRRR